MGGGGAPPAGMDFSNLLNQFQATSIGPQDNQQHPADRYRSQLQQLRDMGFDDEQNSLRALVSNGGNLNRAVDNLIMGTVPAFVSGVDDLPALAAPTPSSEGTTPPAADPKDEA